MVVNTSNEALSSRDEKIEQEINFLQERLLFMQQQKNPNKMMLETYRNMLDCRLSVQQELCARQSNNRNSISCA